MEWLWRWLLDEDFWKQVAVNVVSAGVVGAIAYTVAVAGGYIREPERMSLWIPLAIAAVPLPFALLGWHLTKRAIAYDDRDEDVPPILDRTSALLLGITSVLMPLTMILSGATLFTRLVYTIYTIHDQHS